MTVHNLVVGKHVYQLRTFPTDDFRYAELTLILDQQAEWSLTVPGWAPIYLGASGQTGYFWTVRQLVTLPKMAGEELKVIEVEDDLVLAFRVRKSWLLICETSIRLFVSGSEIDRVQLGEVAISAQWNEDTLYVHDFNGRTLLFRVDGMRILSW